MTSLLIMFGYLLNIILFIAVYQLFKQLQEIKQNQQTDIDDLLEHYVSEIKHENLKLQQLLEKNNEPTVNFKEQLDQEQERYLNEEDVSNHSTNHNEVLKETTLEENISDQPMIDLLGKHEDSFEQSLESKVITLKEQGLTTNAIAQNLNRGNTEIELVLKFLKH